MRRTAVFVLASFMTLLTAGSALAARVTWPTDQNVTVNGITLVIGAGSQVDRFQYDDKNLTVGVANGDTFVLHAPAPGRNKLVNDAGLAECYVPANQSDNAVIVNGPLTVTFTPSAESCAAPPLPAGGQIIPLQLSALLALPNGGESLKAGDVQQVLWSTGGSGIGAVRFLLSTDGGESFPTVLVASTDNDGSYAWTVPLMTTTNKARLRVEALDANGKILVADNSNADFTVTGTAPAAQPAPPALVAPTRTGPYSAADELAATASINADKGLATAVAAIYCSSGSAIKGSASSVYYCGSDGKRYVFPTSATFFTWYADFSGVTTIADADLQKIPLGGNATYRPGQKLVKITTDPKVYAVSQGGILRWVTTEALAKTLYGDNWAQQVDDIPDAFFVNYTVGEPISALK